MLILGHNKKAFLVRRRELRVKQTDAEKKLWYYLRGRRLLNRKFSRQYGIGPYILDFFCFEIRLAIELDGGQHAELERIRYDEVRTEFLVEHGIRVIRFWNNEVLNEIDSVLERIYEYLQDSPQPSLSERGPKTLP